MSLDSGTYILQSLGENGDPEYRVAQAFAIENIWNEQSGMKSLFELFRESPPVVDFFQASDIASQIDNAEETEFGVLLITDFAAMKFEDIKKAATDGEKS
jgi:hypothetical protein